MMSDRRSVLFLHPSGKVCDGPLGRDIVRRFWVMPPTASLPTACPIPRPYANRENRPSPRLY